MNWFREIQDEDVEYDPIDNEPQSFSITKFQTDVLPFLTNLNNDIILQWIVSPFLNASEGLCYQIPLHSNEIYEYVFKNIINHFQLAEGIYTNDKITMIRLSDLKFESKEYFQKQVLDSQFISPVVHDFYLKEEFGSRIKGAIDCQNIEVDIDVFRNSIAVSGKETNESLWEFFRETHILPEGNIIMSPQNWLFNNDLLCSSALEYFSRFANKIILTVNKTNQHVRAIEMT